MAPAKASAASKGATSQLSIASFFGVKPASGASAKKKSPKKSPEKKKLKETLSIPSEGGETQLKSPPSKRVGVESFKKNLSGDGDEKSLRTNSPISPDSTARKSDEVTKSKDWIATPSPNEPAKSGTKTFGRRDRKALKSGVVAPVLNSSIDSASTKSGGTTEISANPESLIGRRLKVFWPLDRVWYAGKVRAYNKASGSHTIRYDDGEDESIVIGKEKVQWLGEETEKGAQKSAAKQITAKCSREASCRRSSSNLKRKKVVYEDEDDKTDVPDEDELEDSLLDELKKNEEADEVQSDISKGRKRPRVDPLEEDSPAKVLIVSTDVYDDVDIPLPEQEQQEEVKVRKRLRKAGGRAPEKSCDDVEEADEADQKAGKPTLRRPSTSARRLQLEDAADEESPAVRNSTKLDDDSLDESFSPSSSEIDSDNEQTSAKKGRKTASTKLDAPKRALDSKLKSQARDFFSKLGVKSTKSAAGTLPTPSVKSISPARDVGIEGPKVLEADMRTKGELHSTLMGEAAERFGGRLEEKFRFLGKGRRDGSGKRPSDPGYDPRTVQLPQDFVKGLSGGQRQWWEFKSKHMDKVLLFKMGKFYEMFEMDAHVGAQELDLQYMKGDQPHCGFPEKLYFENAEKLARKGYRVLVVEQTETPDQLEQRRRETGSKDKVVRREVCAVLTKGTIVDGEMLETSPDAAYLMSITEEAPVLNENSVAPENSATIGVCFVDTSTSHVMLSQFDDDAARSSLRSVLSELRPVELIKPRGVLTEATERAIKDHTRQPLAHLLAPGQEFWDAHRSREEILEVYGSFRSSTKPSSGKASRKKTTVNDAEQLQMLPKALRRLVEAGSQGEAALSALGGCIFYLREALLDKTVLRLGRIELLPGSHGLSTADGLAEGSNEEGLEEGPEANNEMQRELYEPYMILDSAALENLEIIENNSDGGTSGTLLAHFDTCVTPYGRRLLKQWLVRPLMRVEPILERQQALVDLTDVAADAAINFRKELKSQSDMERLLARLHASSGACGRNADNVVLYEDAAKKQLQEFMGALRGCRALLRSMKSFESCLSELTSNRLRELVTPGLGVPDMAPIIEHFETAFDPEEAEMTGRIVPNEGVDSSFDEADSAVKTATKELADYLDKQRKKFGNSSEINYVTVGKEQYQMEIPEKFHAKVPSSFEVKSSRKGFRRYWTPEIKELLQDLTSGEQQRELALRGILQGLVKRFCEDYPKWLALVKSVAEVDVLVSLSEATMHSSPTCRPTFVTDSRKIVAEGIRHPIACLSLAGGGSFVPNNVALGADGPPFMLLTGPNMGGKSTLIRQICLAVVSAQIGANVTADHFEVSPVDRVFVRMGAKDHIMAGQSTFLVELSETATMLRSATRNSLVALDELGRGTSTSDGQAIAHAVLEHLAHNVGCRGMFSTHYHRLASHFASDSRVGLHHMSCKVGTGDDGLEEVVFLYKLAAGACPKSYGVNVARLAGMPESVLRRATERAEELELLWGKKTDHSSQSEPKESASADSSDDNDGGSESEITVVKEAAGLVKKMPEDVSTDVGHSALLLLWQEAKRILGSCEENSKSSVVIKQEPGICA